MVIHPRSLDTNDVPEMILNRSWAMRADEARSQSALPVGLLDKGKVLRDIPKGTLITRDAVAVNTDTPLYRLRSQQDAWLGYEACA